MTVGMGRMEALKRRLRIDLAGVQAGDATIGLASTASWGLDQVRHQHSHWRMEQAELDPCLADLDPGL